MKNFSRVLACLAGSTLLFACSDEVAVNNDNNTNNAFTATQEQLTNGGEYFDATRTTLNSKDNTYNIDWTKGDAINLWDGKTMCKYEVVSANGTECTFTSSNSAANKDASQYIAVYPYSMKTTVSGNTVSNLELSYAQTATDNGFDPTCNLMVATTKTLNEAMGFKNVCSYIKVHPNVNCYRIVLKAPNQNIAGKFDLTVDENGNQTISNITEASDSIVLVGDIKENTDYYLAVLPGNYENGIKITYEPELTRSDVDYENRKINSTAYYRTSTNTLNATRANFISLGVFSQDNKNYKQNETFTISFEDMYGDDWNAESGTKVFWAKNNIGATADNNKGDYFAWGEVKSKNVYTKESYLCNNYYPTKLDTNHDAATVNWGHGWRMPTIEDFKNLKANCIFVLDNYFTGAAKPSGIYVFRGGKENNTEVKDYQKMANDAIRHYEIEGVPAPFTTVTDENVAKYINSLSPSKDRYIYIPFGGHIRGTGTTGGNDAARYWMNSHGDGILPDQEGGEGTAYYWGIDANAFNSMSHYRPRYEGMPIRPVFEITWKGNNQSSKSATKHRK